MNILIVSATSFEIEELKRWLGEGVQVNDQILRFQLKNLTVDTLVTGIGMVATAYWLTKTLQECKYGLVINAGICGFFHRNLELGSVVNVIEDTFSELGYESGTEIISFIGVNHAEGVAQIRVKSKFYNLEQPKIEIVDNLACVKGITVNTVHGNAKSIASLMDRLDADTESMEGASVFFVCHEERVPCIQIRAVSNYVEERDISKWDIPLAVKNLNSTLIEILKALH